MRTNRKPIRRGVATVEAAVVSPVLVLLAFGFIEVGGLVNHHHVLQDAARQGARAAVRLENSNTQVRAAVESALDHTYSIDPADITVRISKLNSQGEEEYEVQNLNENEQGAAIRVTVTVNYGRFQPISNFLGFGGQSISGAAVMRRKP